MKRHKILSAIVVLAMLSCTLGGCTNQEKEVDNVSTTAVTGTGTTMEYESKLFGDEPITINIIVENDEWQKMLDNASDEEYISVNLEVNNESYSNVGIRTKGNSSLSMVDDDRYSLKVKFDKYEDNQTCSGLDKLVLNNIISDNTYMKDYLAFDMMNYMGVEASLYNYAVISVNGEYWGLYLALEGYDSSYCERVSGNDDGNLYNVKMNMNQGKNGEANMPKGDGDETITTSEGNEDTTKADDVSNQNTQTSNSSDTEKTDSSVTAQQQGGNGVSPKDLTESLPEGFDIDDYIEKSAQEGFSLTSYLEELGLTEADFNIPSDANMDLEDMLDMVTAMKSGDFPNGGGMAMGAGSTGGALLYTDDEISSYSSIFDNAVFNHTDEEDEQRVIEAIKALNSGENIENYFNVDEILRYLAVHTVLCNFDSYSSSMAQNYYIYESDGVVSILPWDYNLAFGGFESNEATECVNWAIDTPVHGVEMEDRPLINQLLSNEEYLATYHEYLQQLVDEYLSTSSEHIDNIVQKISSYVETDPTANCTYEEFETAVKTLKSFVELRAESIMGQLDGTIPSTTEAQNADSTSLVDASSINLSDMGSQGGKDDKGGKGMPGGGNGGDTSMPDSSQENSDD